MEIKIIKLLIVAAFIVFTGCSYKALNNDDEEKFFSEQVKIYSWVNDHYQSILDEFLPLKEKYGLNLSYRRYRDHYTYNLENSFVFNFGIVIANELTVTVRKPDSISLYDQLLELKAIYPKDSFEFIKNRLKVKMISLQEQDCPAIRKQYDDFYKMKLPINEADTIRTHHWIHTFIAPISAGNIQAVIEDDDHPFVKWAKKTEEALDECIRVGINNGSMEWERPNIKINSDRATILPDRR